MNGACPLNAGDCYRKIRDFRATKNREITILCLAEFLAQKISQLSTQRSKIIDCVWSIKVCKDFSPINYFLIYRKSYIPLKGRTLLYTSNIKSDSWIDLNLLKRSINTGFAG